MCIEPASSARCLFVLAMAAMPVLAGDTDASAPSMTFSLSLDRAVYVSSAQSRSPAQLLARLTLRHTLADPLRLDFPTPQVFDLAVRSESGEIVRQWSDGKFFPQVLHSETIVQGEKNYAVSVRLAGTAGSPLPPGRYLAEAWLTTTGGRFYGARVGFAIVQSPQRRGSPRRTMR
jgi:hypothetical protein